MKRKENILLLADVIIQVLLLLLAFVCSHSIEPSVKILVALFIYQLFSCIIHEGFPISFFRKIYHRVLIPVLILCTILIVLGVMDIGFALYGVLWLAYCTPQLMICYLFLTFFETLENDPLP